jgi:hypothetical protein
MALGRAAWCVLALALTPHLVAGHYELDSYESGSVYDGLM